MKRTAILLEESLLLEVQQLAKEQQVTVSQVIQQAVADYVESQRRGRSHPTELEGAVPPIEPSEPPAEPAQQPAPALWGSQTGRALWPAFIALILGGVSALFALLELLLAAEKFAGSAQPLVVALNHLLPGVLLVIVAAAFIFIALHLLRPRTV